MPRGTTAPSRTGGRWPKVVVGTKMSRRSGGRSAAMAPWFIIDKVKGEFVGLGISFHGDYNIILGVVREVIGHVVGWRWGRTDAAVENIGQ